MRITVRIIAQLFLAVLFFIPASFGQQRHCGNCGIILHQHRVFDTLGGRWVQPEYHKDLTIWYKDSLVIEEAQRLNIINDHRTGKETWEIVIDHYTFIDLRSRSFYEYTSFSDTAVIRKKYTQPDSAYITGGWNFYRYNHVMMTKNLHRLGDTIMNGINYMRIKSEDVRISNGKETRISGLGYLRCGKRNTLFRVDNPLSKKMGCPLVRYEFFERPANRFVSTQIEFLTDRLTDEQLKIFAAWELNAHNNPVR